jgi:NAD-dependent deacetylase
MDIDPRLLTELRRPNGFTLFVTGAGISLASGIQTFRGDDPGAVWANDVLEMGTLRFFQKDPVGSWKWYLSRFDKCRGSEPNPGHTAIVDIEKYMIGNGAEFLLLTQNVDGLHIQAGSERLCEVHGAARKMRCSNRSCVNGAPRGFLGWDDTLFAAFREDPTFENLPRCPACRKPLRAHVLWFDESYADHEDYELDTWLSAISRADSMVFVGTSFSVSITESCIQQAGDLNLPTFIIDPAQTGEGWNAGDNIVFIQEKAEEYLPAVVAAL